VKPEIHPGLAAAAEAASRLSDRSPEQLAADLYTTWYAAAVGDSETPADFPDDLEALFRAAHAGNERWEHGWQVDAAASAGRIIASCNGEQRSLDRSEYVSLDRPGIVASIGTHVLAPARRDHVDTGRWWYTHAPGWRLDAPTGPLVRIYWNISVADTALLVHELTSRLLDHTSPWMLKCALDTASYKRADAAVLFLTRPHLDRGRSVIDHARAALTGELRAATPPLTLSIGHGVAVCDDPGTGESFGEHRCRLIAEGLQTRSHANGEVAAIAKRFRRARVPPDRPYLAHPSRRLPWE
jgi:HopA1 effector protein family